MFALLDFSGFFNHNFVIFFRGKTKLEIGRIMPANACQTCSGTFKVLPLLMIHGLRARWYMVKQIGKGQVLRSNINSVAIFTDRLVERLTRCFLAPNFPSSFQEKKKNKETGWGASSLRALLFFHHFRSS